MNSAWSVQCLGLRTSRLGRFVSPSQGATARVDPSKEMGKNVERSPTRGALPSSPTWRQAQAVFPFPFPCAAGRRLQHSAMACLAARPDLAQGAFVTERRARWLQSQHTPRGALRPDQVTSSEAEAKQAPTSGLVSQGSAPAGCAPVCRLILGELWSP